jgi:hypothetical protein
MAQPAPVTITMWGHYVASEDTGRIYAQFRNDSSATISGHAYFVITEDSLYRVTSNGDQWHNHVARDYVPNHLGVVVSIPAGESLVVDQPLSFDPTWLRHMCEIITWIQDDNLQPDSTKEVWQAGILQVTDLTYVEEEVSDDIVVSDVTVLPNPCITSTAFTFNIAAGSPYMVTLFDVAGRAVRTLQGQASVGHESVQWNLLDDRGAPVPPGVYFYRFEGADQFASGKVVVR